MSRNPNPEDSRRPIPSKRVAADANAWAARLRRERETRPAVAPGVQIKEPKQ